MFIYILIIALKKSNLDDYEISRYNDIRILKYTDKPEEKISIEVFIISNKGKWNVVEKLLKIDGIKIKNNYNYINIGFVHANDTGKIVPENSTKYQNKNFR
jgi:hypothetical protein